MLYLKCIPHLSLWGSQLFWQASLLYAVCIMYHSESQVCFLMASNVDIKCEFTQSSSSYHWRQASPNRWGIKAQMSEPHDEKENEDDSSSHKTRICCFFLSLLKDNTHSVVQLNLPSSWLIFFVHCVIGYKMVDSRDIFQLFNITSGKGHPRVSCGGKRTQLCWISWQLLMLL